MELEETGKYLSNFLYCYLYYYITIFIIYYLYYYLQYIIWVILGDGNIQRDMSRKKMGPQWSDYREKPTGWVVDDAFSHDSIAWYKGIS